MSETIGFRGRQGGGKRWHTPTQPRVVNACHYCGNRDSDKKTTVCNDHESGLRAVPACARCRNAMNLEAV